MKIRWNVHRQTWEVVDLATFKPIRSFSKCHEAEAWVLAEAERQTS